MKFRRMFIVAVALLTSLSGQDKPETTFKVDVKLVNVFVTVTDQQGAPIGNLGKNDFSLSEDGVPQKIAVFSKESQLPLSIVLAIDTSSSTRKDIRLELEAARRFIHSMIRPQDSVSLYTFATNVSEMTPFTAKLHQVDSAINEVRVGGATSLYDAIYLGAKALINRQGRKVMVLITDGGDTASSIDYKEALRAAQQSEALVYSLIDVPVEASAGRNTGGEHALIQISSDTGGKYYYAANVGQLDRAFEQISDELRTQYLLAYYPVTRRAASDFREIDVTAHPHEAAEAQGSDAGEKLVVRARRGYYTSKLE
ncbi:MAG: VWA domain-containing protein [Acidobacteria bacterium]|nr:MAG: VWA domain-containing protein [Acidobacteriota bacterium]